MHFACCFLYTTANAHAAKLRELFQGLVRVGRDPKDPLGDERELFVLRDERIFVLIEGKLPNLEYDPTPQPRRHAAFLWARRRKATCAAMGAANAKRTADARCGIDGAALNDAEVPLDEAMISLLAWNDLEAEDNAGGWHAIKMMELCKLPTREWTPKMMGDLSLAEKEEVAKLEFDLQKRGPSMRPLTADAVVSCMSPAEAYDWLHEVEFKRERDTEGNVLSVESCRAQFLRDQRALLNEQRPEYDATGAMRHEIYEVLLHFHADSIEETKWPADGKAFARMRHVVELLKMRAQLKYVPRDELEVTHEMQRFLLSEKWAHSAVITPAHTMHSCSLSARHAWWKECMQSSVFMSSPTSPGSWRRARSRSHRSPSPRRPPRASTARCPTT